MAEILHARVRICNTVNSEKFIVHIYNNINIFLKFPLTWCRIWSMNSTTVVKYETSNVMSSGSSWLDGHQISQSKSC